MSAALVLYRAAAVVLALGALGHTLGGMIGTARHGPQAGAEADRVLADMRAVRFSWRGVPDSTWFAFWYGNGLGVSALLLVPIVLLWVLGGLDHATALAVAPVTAATVASLVALGALGFKYFASRVGSVFLLVAALAAAATGLAWTA